MQSIENLKIHEQFLSRIASHDVINASHRDIRSLTIPFIISLGDTPIENISRRAFDLFLRSSDATFLDIHRRVSAVSAFLWSAAGLDLLPAKVPGTVNQWWLDSSPYKRQFEPIIIDIHRLLSKEGSTEPSLAHLYVLLATTSLSVTDLSLLTANNLLWFDRMLYIVPNGKLRSRPVLISSTVEAMVMPYIGRFLNNRDKPLFAQSNGTPWRRGPVYNALFSRLKYLVGRSHDEQVVLSTLSEKLAPFRGHKKLAA